VSYPKMPEPEPHSSPRVRAAHNMLERAKNVLSVAEAADELHVQLQDALDRSVADFISKIDRTKLAWLRLKYDGLYSVYAATSTSSDEYMRRKDRTDRAEYVYRREQMRIDELGHRARAMRVQHTSGTLAARDALHHAQESYAEALEAAI
jgi:hypothetical protein